MVVLVGKSRMFLLLRVIYLTNVLIAAESHQHIFSSWLIDINYNPQSRYQTSLKAALSSLPNANSGYGFYNLSVGDGIDIANAIMLCRGDVDRRACHSCLNDTIVKLAESARNASEGEIVYDDCFLRFSNKTILGYTTYRYDFAAWSLKQVGNSDQFNSELTSLMHRLRKEAAGGGSLLKFATGNTNLTDSMAISRVLTANTSEPDATSIFGLVQCTPDLSAEQCNDCLEKSLSKMIEISNGSINGRIFSPWCNLRYSNELFYNDTPIIRASTPVALASPASTASLPSGMRLWSRWLI